MSLKEYKEKREFEKTPEPEGKKRTGKEVAKSKGDTKVKGDTKGESNIYVVQKHDASHLHYDLRLEIDGVLKSWAVPKGPSVNPKVRRLAIETEDHPIEYADFEGVIPEGYGAGTVMVWDHGTYENLSEKDGNEISAERAYEKGHITFKLKGKKLKGGYSLVKTGRKKQWLLIKKKDDHADSRKKPVSSQPKSSKTGRSLEEIEKEEDE